MEGMAFAHSGALITRQGTPGGGPHCGLLSRRALVHNAAKAHRMPAHVALANTEAAKDEESATRSARVLNVDLSNGGWIVDAEAVNFKQTSVHTVIVGRRMMTEMCDEGGVEVPPPERVVEWLLEYFMSHGQSLTNTIGLQDPAVFPVNYFSLRQVFYFFPDFRDVLIERTKALYAESGQQASDS